MTKKQRQLKDRRYIRKIVLPPKITTRLIRSFKSANNGRCIKTILFLNRLKN